MADDSIFLESGAGLVEMAVGPYESEADLQTLLEHHPALLGGAQMTSGDPRRFVLVGREYGVPDAEGGHGRWSLDHLFVDQDAVPTFVEVKRSSNREIRRQVVGQMLDYAANGTRYWPVEDLEAAFARTHGDKAAGILTALVGAERAEGFWDQVVEHLRQGRIRLVFLADRIPSELRRIVEWLNEQTTDAEILAVEVLHYSGGGHRCLVPRVIGATTRAADAKHPGRRPGFEDLLADAGPDVKVTWDHLQQWAENKEVAIRPTRAGRQFHVPGAAQLFQFYPGFGTVEFTLDPLRSTAPATAESLLAAINNLTGGVAATKYPSVRCDLIADDWDGFRAQVLDPLLSDVGSLSPESP